MKRSSISRRKFLTLAAAGAAATIAAPATAATPSRTKPARRPEPKPAPAAAGRRTASAAEIEKLRGYTAESLKAIRAYALPPGSDLAFSFRPLKPRRGRRED